MARCSRKHPVLFAKQTLGTASGHVETTDPRHRKQSRQHKLNQSPVNGCEGYASKQEETYEENMPLRGPRVA